MTVTVHTLPALSDNYIYVIERAGKAAVIDPGDAEPVIDFLNETELELTLIINTHHHSDHSAGNDTLQQRYHCPLAAPQGPITNVDITLAEGTPLSWQGLHFDILATPGHTMDHIVLVERQQAILFSGDTLFRLGCGRLFEGTAQNMFDAMQKIKMLDDQITVYCGHEYSQANAEFALSLGNNSALEEESQTIQTLRQSGQATSPFNLGRDKRLNPFLTAQDVETFTQRRQAKDHF